MVPLLNAPHALEHCIPECEVKGSPIVGLHPPAELGEVVPELIDDGGMVYQVETILRSQSQEWSGLPGWHMWHGPRPCTHP